MDGMAKQGQILKTCPRKVTAPTKAIKMPNFSTQSSHRRQANNPISSKTPYFQHFPILNMQSYTTKRTPNLENFLISKETKLISAFAS